MGKTALATNMYFGSKHFKKTGKNLHSTALEMSSEQLQLEYYQSKQGLDQMI